MTCVQLLRVIFKMADNIYNEIFEFSETLWDPMINAFNNAVVYMDDGVAEILHWSGRVLDVLDAGSKGIQSLSLPVVRIVP